MQVTVIRATEKPLEVISRAAGMSHGVSDISEKRVRKCFEWGHLSVFEHASVTFEIKGVSRCCANQIVRHRLASFVQESQRYCKIDTSGNDWYVIPPSFAKVDKEWFESNMERCARNYNIALHAKTKAEDARYLLPEATKTNLVMTMNLRELYHFWNMRTDSAAQWEIREVANATISELCELDNGDWEWFVQLWKDSKTGE